MFFQTVLYPIYFKSYKHEHIFYLCLPMPSEFTLHYFNGSLKINRLPTFSEIAWVSKNCVYMVR